MSKDAEYDDEGEAMEVTVHLFGKPAWMIENFEGEDMTYETIEQIRTLGASMKSWLERAAEIAKLLKENGWELNGGLYDLNAYKSLTPARAKAELKKLGIRPNEVSLMYGESQIDW